MPSRQSKKPIKKKSESDFDLDDFIIVKKRAKIPQKDITISQIMYDIITSDFLKGLSQDMIKFAAMFLLTSYLRGEPLPLHIFNRAINREVREASAAVDFVTQTEPESRLYDEDDPEYKLPMMLNALQTFEDSKVPETKINIDAIEDEIGLEYNQIMEGFTNPEMIEETQKKTICSGLKKMKGGGQGVRNRNVQRREAMHDARPQPIYISTIIADAIAYARHQNMPNDVLKTVLEILARTAIILLIYGVLHTAYTDSEFLIKKNMDYKSMFAYYMERYKNKKTAKDLSEDVEHYKDWAKENIGGARKKKLKKEDSTTSEEGNAAVEIKEIEESSWFKRFYKNTIKPTANKIYDIATSDEAVTAAKITAQILILSLLMYAANEAKGAMYEYIGRPAYNKTMQVYYGMQNPLRNLNEMEDLISLDPKHPNYKNYEELFRASEPRLREMGYENRELYFKENPKSSMRKYFPIKAEEETKEGDLYIEMARAAQEELRVARLAEAAKLAEDARLAEDSKRAEAAKVAEIKEFDEGAKMLKEELLIRSIERAIQDAKTSSNLANARKELEKSRDAYNKRTQEERVTKSTKDAEKAQRKLEKDAKKARELEEVRAEMERKAAAKKSQKPTRGLGLSDHKNKFYEFIASKDAKNMAKAAAVGLIGTVLTILANQGASGSNKKIIASFDKVKMEPRPREIDTDLSYYGIPDY